jgi:hypothetical protein
MLSISIKKSPEEKRRELEELVQKADNGMDVYRYFIQDKKPVKLGLMYHSPLPGHVDKHPSFNLFRSKTDGMIWWKDHAIEGGNVWKFIQHMQGCTFGEAVRWLRDFLGVPQEDDNVTQLTRRLLPPLVLKTKQDIERVAPQILPMNRPEDFYCGVYAAIDEKYYPKHLFGAEVLKKYRTTPLMNYRFIKADPDDPKDFTIHSSVTEPMYHYKFLGDDMAQGYLRHKVVRPYSKFKWISTTVADEDIFGLHLLPLHQPKLPVLVVLAGQRDTMAFHKLTGLPACCFSAEGHYPSHRQINLLHSLADRVFVLYDLDKTGLKMTDILTGNATQDWLDTHPNLPLYNFLPGLNGLLRHFDPDGSQKLDVTKLLLSRPVWEHKELATWWRQACGIF